MLQMLRKSISKKVAMLLVFSLVFCTNSFNNLSKVYAEENSSKVESVVNEEGEKESLTETTVKESSAENVDDTTKDSDKSTENKVDIEPEESANSEEEKNDTKDDTSSKEKTDESSSDISDDKKTESNETKVDEKKESDVKTDNENVSKDDASETKKEETKTNEIKNDETKKDEKVATESVVSETTKPSDIKETDEAITEKDQSEDNIATESEIDIIATESEIDIEYESLDAFNQILYQDIDAASMYENVIILLEDIELTKPIYFKDGETLNLSGHTILGPSDNYAVYVENNFTLENGGENIGKIVGNNNNFPAMYLKNAVVELNAGIVEGAKGENKEKESDDAKDPLYGGDAIHAYDSDVTINGAHIYGGKGAESFDDIGGNGGDAVKVVSATDINTLNVVSGTVVGGHAGNGYGDKKPTGGAPIIIGKFLYEGEYLGNGLSGNVGGGDGGNGINIQSDKFKLTNLTFEKYLISSGNNGYSVSKDVNESKIEEQVLFNSSYEPETSDNQLFGASYSAPYYSLHDDGGKNFLTTLKYQNPTGLCTAFAFTAYAETYLIKKYPDYVKNVLNKNVDDTLDLSRWTNTSVGHNTPNYPNELNLSEMQFGMQLFTQPRDEFGNAGDSKQVPMSGESAWSGIGSNSYTLAVTATTWRSLVEEDNNLTWPEWGESDTNWNSSAGKTIVENPVSRDTLNSYVNKTVVHPKNALIRDLGNYYDGTTFNRDEFLTQAKKDIVDHNGLEFFIYTLGRSKTAEFPNPGDPSNPTHYVKDGVDYGEVTILDAEPTTITNLGGHALYCIGWDDDVEVVGSFGTYTGAFICKNSWHHFTLIPYDNAWGVTTGAGTVSESTWYMDYMVTDFTPSFSEYENIYFYDSGVSTLVMLLHNNEAAVNTFEIRNPGEKIKALSFYANEPGNYEVSIYKVSTLDNNATLKNDLSNDSNRLFSETVTASKGMNTIEAPIDTIYHDGDKFAVKVKYGVGAKISVDALGSSPYGDNYTTVRKGRSFFVDSTSGNITSVGENARIRLITNNMIKLDANWDTSITDANQQNGQFNGTNTAWFEPTLRASLSNITEPTAKTGKVFRNYNTAADGSGTTYDNNSLYHLDIADNLVLYAQYEDSTDNKTLSFNKGHNSATGSMNSITRANGTVINAPTSTFVRTGYEFDYWEDNSGNHINKGEPITLNDNITLTAVWKAKTYNIDYELNGATISPNPVSTIRYDEELPLPQASTMTYEGHSFVGWYDNEAMTGTPLTNMKVNASNPQDLRLYALWEVAEFTITFNMKGHGEQVTSQTVEYGERVIRPATNPTEIGWAFGGWYEDEACETAWDFNTRIYDDKVLYAKWTAAVNVVFVTDHGRAPATQFVTDGGRATEPAAISVVGYTFKYWYENDENVAFDFNTVLNLADGGVRTLTAKWEVKVYTITYELNGGRLPADSVNKYTYGVGATLPSDVTPPDYKRTFAGWYDNDSFTGKVITKISATEYGDKVYYAKYNRVPSGSSSGTNGGSTGGSATGGNVTSPAYTELRLGPEANPIHDTTLNINLKAIPVTMNTTGSTWDIDENGNMTLTLKNAAGVPVEAKNIFACVTTTYTDRNGVSTNIQDFYYFDNNGKMYTGWLRDNINTTYYFNESEAYLGKLARGWTEIKGDYYYFDGNGNLQKSTITPDGYAIDSNGKWIENAGQEGFINVNNGNEIDPSNGTTSANGGTSADEEVITASKGSLMSGGAILGQGVYINQYNALGQIPVINGMPAVGWPAVGQWPAINGLPQNNQANVDAGLAVINQGSTANQSASTNRNSSSANGTKKRTGKVLDK